MKPDEMQPGEAFEKAAKAVRERRYEEAISLLPHMLPSDRKIINRRIAQAQTVEDARA